jgi:Sulfotransferase family
MELSDLRRRAGYRIARHAGDLVRVAGGEMAARLDLLRDRPEVALLRYGRLVRHVQLARESASTYRKVDRLVRRFPERLAAFRPRPVSPERFLMFLGYSRSGHSLVAALLDAHPNVLISHELHALKHLRAGRPFAEVVAAIQYNSRFFGQFGRGYSGYSYEVPSQHQGAFTELRIIGDKKANGTARILRREPAVVDALDRLIPVPFVFLHVVRNPLDNIASRARRTNTSLERAARGYFANADAIDRLKRRRPDRVVDIYLDDLTARPKESLAALLRTLGIADADDRYLSDCAEIVFKQPDRTRDRVAWCPGLRRSIEDRVRRYGFLARFAAKEAGEVAA